MVEPPPPPAFGMVGDVVAPATLLIGVVDAVAPATLLDGELAAIGELAGAEAGLTAAGAGLAGAGAVVVVDVPPEVLPP